MAGIVDLFFLVDSKNAPLKVILPDGSSIDAKSDAYGGVQVNMKKALVTSPSTQLTVAATTQHTRGFMANVTTDACILSAMSGNNEFAKINSDRLINLFAKEFLGSSKSPMWDTVRSRFADAQPLLKEFQDKILRTMQTGDLTIAKGVSFKHQTVFVNFINHEFEKEIIPTAYKHAVVNGGDVVLRFAGFRGSGDFCQWIFNNRRWISVIGSEQKGQIQIKRVHYKTRAEVDARIQLGDMGFLQHIAETWTDAAFSGKVQPHRNIELVMFDMRDTAKPTQAASESEKRYKYILGKLKMLFDENEPADTDKMWVQIMREVYFDIGRELGHVVSGRLIRI